MKAKWLILVACIAGGMGTNTQADAADREFKDVVRAISDQFQTRPMHIPLFGLANVVLKVAHPAGAKHVELAIFQNLDDRKGTGRDLTESVRFAIGRSWQPFVQVRSHRRGEENVLVYMREMGRDLNLLVVTMQRDQAVVVEARVDPKELQRWIDSPEESTRRWRGTSGGRWRDEDSNN